MTTATEALTRLREGNRRFVSGISHRKTDSERRKQLVGGQSPYAIIIGCADSRVPVELVFDEGLGDLFVIRVAGNIIDEAVTGSAEYAAANLGTTLVVVMGHTSCGAVAATLHEIEQPTADLSSNLRFIVDSIKPAVLALGKTGSGQVPDDLLSSAVHSNILQSVKHLKQHSSILRKLVDSGQLMIVGARYDLETGGVEFFNDQS